MSVVLRLFTDFVCPFCFVAENSTVPQLLAQFDLELDWCGFELHPQTPIGGMPLSALFPAARIPGVKEHMRQFSARFGVTGIQHPEHISNTRRALAMAEFARSQNKLDAFRQAAMDANWRQQRNLESPDDLAELARTVGLDVDQALAASESPTYLALVDAKQKEAKRLGVTGIPTFMFGTEVVTGCQPFEVLAAAAQRAGAQSRTRSS